MTIGRQQTDLKLRQETESVLERAPSMYGKHLPKLGRYIQNGFRKCESFAFCVSGCIPLCTYQIFPALFFLSSFVDRNVLMRRVWNPGELHFGKIQILIPGKLFIESSEPSMKGFAYWVTVEISCFGNQGFI